MRSLGFVVLVAACGDDGAVTVDAGPCVDLGHDEDGDGVGDACDICPAVADPRQLDTTERATMIAFPDGVGDACDPRPSLSGDMLGAFHPFVDPATVAAWTGTGYAIETDRARATGDARWIHRTREQGDGLFVQARVGALAWTAEGRFELVLDGNGVESGLLCAIARDRDGDGDDELEVHELGGSPVAKTAGMAIGGAITLTAHRVIDPQRRGVLRCRVVFDGGMALLELPTTDDIAVGTYGMAQRNATTEVASFVVYTSPSLPGDDL